MALQGIDVSSFQSGLNLDNVNYDFVAIKATQGVNYVNPNCDQHFNEAEAKGKKLAVYHYADGNDAIAEADYFVDNCAGYIGKAIFVLDWEGTGVEDTAWALNFLQRVESRIGYKPAIYMSESVENTYDWSNVVSADYGLWLAKYSDYEIDNNYDMSGAGKAPSSKYWPFYFMWQWTSKGHLNGYAGDLDCDIAYLTAEQWDKYAGVVEPIAEPIAAPVVEPEVVVAPAEAVQEPNTTAAPIITITPVADATVAPTPVELPPVAVVIGKETKMNKVIEFLKGKKTYIVAALIAVINFLAAEHLVSLDGPTVVLINGIFGGAGLATLRAAVASTQNKL